MSKNSVFVIRNHENRYLTKKHKWRNGSDNSLLFRSAERDVALNELIEVNAKDIMARLQLVLCELDDRDHPAVEVLAEDPADDSTEDPADPALSEAVAQMAGQSGKPALELAQNRSN